MALSDRIAPPILKNRLALVTGAGQGNGAALARGLALAGADVVVTDINAETAGRTAADIKRSGGNAWSFALDVTSPAECAALAGVIERDVGRVNLLVNNAGILMRDAIDTPDVADHLERTLKVNVRGAFHVTHAFVPHLRTKGGTVVNVASITAFAAGLGMLSYAPSKGALKMLTQALAGELAPYGIRVNAIAPGVIATAMSEVTRAAPERLAKYMARTPLGRVADPEELIGPVIFLSSEMSSYVTGITLPVDGGYLAV
jgi:NAD(P)-dependent dehydrogenase (short-subunit alcohol dehydrogenase family)